MLSPLQQLLIQLISGLPEAKSFAFALAGAQRLSPAARCIAQRRTWTSSLPARMR